MKKAASGGNLKLKYIISISTKWFVTELKGYQWHLIVTLILPWCYVPVAPKISPVSFFTESNALQLRKRKKVCSLNVTVYIWTLKGNKTYVQPLRLQLPVRSTDHSRRQKWTHFQQQPGQREVPLPQQSCQHH